MKKNNIKIEFDQLPDDVYNVCVMGRTEMPFTGKYYIHSDEGAYNCIICDKFLFDSNHKYDSKTGWPSFFDVAGNNSINFKQDKSHDMVRTEISCADCNAHLGHVFDDGPTPTGKRYCVNSVSLNFKSSDKLK